MSRFSKVGLTVVIIGALMIGLHLSRGRTSWTYIAATTGIKVPVGAVIGTVERRTEVAYRGIIDLTSKSDIETFIASNGLEPMSAHLESDGLVHKGTLVYGVPKERYSNTYVLFGRSDSHAWEFVLDATSGRVEYELLAPDLAGDVP